MHASAEKASLKIPVVRRPSPSRSRRAVPHRRGAVAPSLAVKEPSAVAPYLIIKEPLAVSTDNSGHSSRPSEPLVRLVVTLPLLTPPPPICRRLSLRPSPFVPLVLLAGCPVSSLLICQRFPLSHRAVASSCHAHLGPLVRLVKASPLLTPPPPICGIIESSQRSSLMLV